MLLLPVFKCLVHAFETEIGSIEHSFSMPLIKNDNRMTTGIQYFLALSATTFRKSCGSLVTFTINYTQTDCEVTFYYICAEQFHVMIYLYLDSLSFAIRTS